MKPINNSPTKVLVTGAGGAAAIAFFKAANELPGIELYMADMDPFSTGLYLVDEDHRCLVPGGDEGQFCAEVLKYCVANEIAVVVPTVDCELAPLSQGQDLFEANGIRLVVSPLEALNICRDKYLLMTHLQSKVKLVDFTLLDETFIADGFGYPFVVKPRIGSGSRGVQLIRSALDLVGVDRDGSYLIQRYLPGPEFSVDVFVNRNGGAIASVIRERIKIDSGIAVIGKTVLNDSLCQMARDIACAVGIRFVANVQFKQDIEGNPLLLEVNPRVPGTISLTVAAGVNIPQMCLQEIRGESVKPVQTYESVAMVRHWSETFMPVDAFLTTQQEV